MKGPFINNGRTEHSNGRTRNPAKYRKYSTYLRRDRSSPPSCSPAWFRYERAGRKASGADYWHLVDITYYDGLSDFFTKTNGPYFYFSTKARHIHSKISYPDGAFLVFGKETKGLPEELLFQHPDNCVRIPMIEQARSLNLANSVAVAAYEVLRQWEYPQLTCKGQLHTLKWEDGAG